MHQCMQEARPGQNGGRVTAGWQLHQGHHQGWASAAASRGLFIPSFFDACIPLIHAFLLFFLVLTFLSSPSSAYSSARSYRELMSPRSRRMTWQEAYTGDKGRSDGGRWQ